MQRIWPRAPWQHGVLLVPTKQLCGPHSTPGCMASMCWACTARQIPSSKVWSWFCSRSRPCCCTDYLPGRHPLVSPHTVALKVAHLPALSLAAVVSLGWAWSVLCPTHFCGSHGRCFHVPWQAACCRPQALPHAPYEAGQLHQLLSGTPRDFSRSRNNPQPTAQPGAGE